MLGNHAFHWSVDAVVMKFPRLFQDWLVSSYVHATALRTGGGGAVLLILVVVVVCRRRSVANNSGQSTPVWMHVYITTKSYLPAVTESMVLPCERCVRVWVCARSVRISQNGTGLFLHVVPCVTL